MKKKKKKNPVEGTITEPRQPEDRIGLFLKTRGKQAGPPSPSRPLRGRLFGSQEDPGLSHRTWGSLAYGKRLLPGVD